MSRESPAVLEPVAGTAVSLLAAVDQLIRNLLGNPFLRYSNNPAVPQKKKCDRSWLNQRI